MEKSRCKFMVWAVILLFLLAPFAISAVGKQADAKAMEITWMMRVKSGEETTWFIQELEKKFNVTILPNGIAKDDREKASIMLAAGEFPDCGFVEEEPKKVYNEGVVRGIPEDMIRKNMPGYTKMLDERPLGWLMNKNPDNENEYLALLGIAEHADTSLFWIGFRADWARNVGIDLPNYEQKKIPLDRFGRNYFLDEDFTLDQLERLLIAFRDGDPDGNGKNDTIPWWGCKYKNWTWEPILGAYGLGFNPNFNIMVDGELYNYAIASGYKDFLKLAARWYSIGLVDREFVNLDLRKAWDKVQEGLIGASNLTLSYAGQAYATERPPNTFVKDEELGTGAEVVMIPHPIGPTGLQSGQAYYEIGPLAAKFYVNKKVSDEKLERILQIVDYTRFDGVESWINGYYGKPGVHFEWEGEAWESQPITKDYADVPAGYAKEGGLGTPYPPGNSRDFIKFGNPKHLADFFVNFLLADRGQSLTIRPYKGDLLHETKLTEVKTKYGDTLNVIVDEFYAKAITGQLDIDAEWDAYVAKWRKNGGDEMLAEIKKAPIVTELRKGKLVY